MAQAVAAALPRLGMGTVRFDFPAHGESPVWQEGLRVPYCIDDLETVEQAILAQDPTAEIAYFSSSFGAYIPSSAWPGTPGRGPEPSSGRRR